MKIAKDQVIGSQPNLFHRFLSRCIATALAPLDAIGHAMVWSKVKSALGKLLSDHQNICQLSVSYVSLLGGRQKLIVSGGSGKFCV